MYLLPLNSDKLPNELVIASVARFGGNKIERGRGHEVSSWKSPICASRIHGPAHVYAIYGGKTNTNSTDTATKTDKFPQADCLSLSPGADPVGGRPRPPSQRSGPRRRRGGEARF